MLRLKPIQTALGALLVAARSSMRCLMLLPGGRPSTALRRLCVIAFDTLNKLREGAHLSPEKLHRLTALLDFGACVNGLLDHKPCRRGELRRNLGLLRQAGMRRSLIEYLRRLRKLEHGRPSPGHVRGQMQAVRRYREEVVRLSLAMALAAASDLHTLDDALQATCDDAGLDLLFRLAMLCQVIDDVLDYSLDRAAGLPSFMTAAPSLPEALEYTRQAARVYAEVPGACHPELLPFRAALALLHVGAMLLCGLQYCLLVPREHGHVIRRIPLDKSC